MAGKAWQQKGPSTIVVGHVNPSAHISTHNGVKILILKWKNAGIVRESYNQTKMKPSWTIPNPVGSVCGTVTHHLLSHCLFFFLPLWPHPHPRKLEQNCIRYSLRQSTMAKGTYKKKLIWLIVPEAGVHDGGAWQQECQAEGLLPS